MLSATAPVAEVATDRPKNVIPTMCCVMSETEGLAQNALGNSTG